MWASRLAGCRECYRVSVAHDIQRHRERCIQSIVFSPLKVASSCDDAKAQGVSACSVTRLTNAKVLLFDSSRCTMCCDVLLQDRLTGSCLLHAPLTRLLRTSRLISWAERSWLARHESLGSTWAWPNRERSLQPTSKSGCYPVRASHPKHLQKTIVFVPLERGVSNRRGR